MDEMEQRQRIEPPEIRLPRERQGTAEFFIDLGEPRPELDLLDLVRAWVEQQAPLTLTNLSFNYQPATDMGEPPLLVGVLIFGEPLDVG
jgi:hypothetical protein